MPNYSLRRSPHSRWRRDGQLSRPLPQQPPPGLGPEDPVVLFDAVCVLCSGWARFLIRHDHQQRFKLASVQSPEGQALLAWFGLRSDVFDTMVLIEGRRAYTRSSSFVRVVARLGWPYRLLALAWLVPRALRDWMYDRVALNRYRLFGRHDHCLMPNPDHDARFLSGSSSS